MSTSQPSGPMHAGSELQRESSPLKEMQANLRAHQAGGHGKGTEAKNGVNGRGGPRPVESTLAQGQPSKSTAAEPPNHKANDQGPSEAALLRDLPFTLQGLSSTNLPFTSTTTLQLPSTLPLPLISILHTLAEPSLLYRSLSEFVQSRDEGLIGQSLRSAIGNELRSYLGLIATLEGEIRRAITSIPENGSPLDIRKSGVTLKRCVVWTTDATLGLRLMNVMAEGSKSTINPP
jgi:gamma-tubulin complex component 3